METETRGDQETKKLAKRKIDCLLLAAQLGPRVVPWVCVAAAETSSSTAYCYLPPSSLCASARLVAAAAAAETEAQQQTGTKVQRLKVETDGLGFVWVGGCSTVQQDTAAALKALQWWGWTILLLPHTLWEGQASPRQRAEALKRARERASGPRAA